MPIHFFSLGLTHSPSVLVRPRFEFSLTPVPTTVAALTLNDGRIILVDAGYSRAELAKPMKSLGLPGLIVPVGAAGTGIADQLEKRGLKAEDVTAIVATHLHVDHIGAYVDFPNAEVIAPAGEFTYGKRRGVLNGYAHIPGILRSGRARPIVWRGTAREGFPAHLDLLGDGQVILFDARGHTAGSVAVWLNDAETGQSVLMAGDAVYSRNEYREHRACWLTRMLAWRDHYVRATWGRLQAFEDAHPESPIIPAHDYDAWCEVCRHD